MYNPTYVYMYLHFQRMIDFFYRSQHTYAGTYVWINCYKYNFVPDIGINVRTRFRLKDKPITITTQEGLWKTT